MKLGDSGEGEMTRITDRNSTLDSHELEAFASVRLETIFNLTLTGHRSIWDYLIDTRRAHDIQRNASSIMPSHGNNTLVRDNRLSKMYELLSACQHEHV